MSKIFLSILSLLLFILVLLMGRTINHQSDTIRMMEKCLNYSDNILDYNEIWDKDGSDYMSDYLNLRYELDSTFLDGFHKRYSSNN